MRLPSGSCPVPFPVPASFPLRRHYSAPQDSFFEGVLFCGQCGSRMGRTSHVKEFGSGDKIKLYGYLCRNVCRIDGRACERKYITCHRLEELVKHVNPFHQRMQHLAVQTGFLTELQQCPQEMVLGGCKGVHLERQSMEKECFKEESNSIRTQRILLRSFAEEHFRDSKILEFSLS